MSWKRDHLKDHEENGIIRLRLILREDGLRVTDVWNGTKAV
jgi:hypothetical protein